MQIKPEGRTVIGYQAQSIFFNIMQELLCKRKYRKANYYSRDVPKIYTVCAQQQEGMNREREREIKLKRSITQRQDTKEPIDKRQE